jgi:HTH-type transcriptional regulator/antitoxin HigA
MDRKNEKIIYEAPVAIPPGATLLEAIEERGIVQAELATRMGRPLKTINEIIKGKAAITVDTAIQLEQVLGISSKMWLNLETNYQETKARLKMNKQLSKEAAIAKNYPYPEMVAFDWVPASIDLVIKVKNLLSFFGVSKLKNVIEMQKLELALYRISKKHQYSNFAIAAWLRKGFLEAQTIETKSFNEMNLKNSLQQIRQLTLEPPEVFYPKITNLLAACGIAFTVVPHLKKAPISGAARWIKPDKALVQLSLRYRFSDIFWFSLFHEIGHLLLHGKKKFSVDLDSLNKESPQEKEADKFATDTLICSSAYRDFVKSNRITDLNVRCFAKEVNIHPGIVVGRLQHDGILSYSTLNQLRTRFVWAKA